ncbi:hypothetical protein VP01_54g1 [Puccinia sorghi]|uniref:Uncharacterized protein n=1 Tax=Puccinia sorghi TaxID=27349 RepID=A0A0L6UJH2_9BASI|nr:hypothetical protein VP01_54g1 [Puccinia sorghi]
MISLPSRAFPLSTIKVVSFLTASLRNKYLNLLKDLVAELNLDTFELGAFLPTVLRSPCGTKLKFVRLAFIRRYPGFYEREQGTLVERAQYLELPVKTGYKSDYLRYHEIVAPTIQILDTYVTLWQSGIYLAPYMCLIGNMCCLHLPPPRGFHWRTQKIACRNRHAALVVP